MKINKISSFTILELMVVMILTSIIVILVYSGFSYFSMLYITYEEKNKKNEEVFELLKRLNNDIEFCDKLINSDNTIVAFSAEKVVQYSFNGDHIARYTKNDTSKFYVENGNVELYYMGENIININSVIDKISFMINHDKAIIMIKKYGPNIYINN
jgi:hypothetical protein